MLRLLRAKALRIVANVVDLAGKWLWPMPLAGELDRNGMGPTIPPRNVPSNQMVHWGIVQNPLCTLSIDVAP